MLNARLIGCMTLGLLVVGCSLSRQTSCAQDATADKGTGADSDQEFWRAYANAVQKFPFEDANRHQSVYALLEIVKVVHQLGKRELSLTLWQRAERLVGEKGKAQHRQHLFQVALAMDELESATQIAEQAEGKRKLQMLDSIDLVRLKRGAKDALKDYPREPMDFWKAMEHGNALVSSEDFEAADKFIRELDIPHEENDPRTIGAIVYGKIAHHYQKKGDRKNARIYIDKAMKIGGNLYYTGYGVKVKKLAIYGELKKGELNKMQKLGVAYGRHMRRELLARLVNELVLINDFEAARETIAYFEKETERDDEYRDLVLALGAVETQAVTQRDDINKVTDQTLGMIKSEEYRSAARLGLARNLFLRGEVKRADKLLDREISQLNATVDPPKQAFRAAGKTLGAMNRTTEFLQIMNRHHDLTSKAMYLLEGIRGYGEKINRKKSLSGQ